MQLFQLYFRVLSIWGQLYLWLRFNKFFYKYKVTINSEKNFNQEFLYVKFKALLLHSYENIPFYKSYYDSCSFDVYSVKSFEDIQKVPIVTKRILKGFNATDRILPGARYSISNTGGTNGEPLSLFYDKYCDFREFHHIRYIFSKLGYRKSAVKLRLRGANFGSMSFKYNFKENEVLFNPFMDEHLVLTDFKKVINNFKIEYIHGFPSLIYEFLRLLEENTPELIFKLKFNLKGIFYSSEFPYHVHRDYIETLLDVKGISWYGHSECAVLSYENGQRNEYIPFQGSYGLVEAVKGVNACHLVGTTLNNFVSPLIRYDTGDSINALRYENKVMAMFEVVEGRMSDFIFDKKNKRISLTSLIHGRHHKIFHYAHFIQVKQVKPGEIDLYITVGKELLDVESLFDSSNVDIDINFYFIKSPFRTKSGKVPLLIQ
jgi:phenylacetate-CoA ligase